MANNLSGGIYRNGKYLYEITGVISNINLDSNRAQVSFTHNDSEYCAFLKVDRFYVDGKRLTNDDKLDRFLKINMPVKFSCHILNTKETNGEFKNWMITACWKINPSLTNIHFQQGITNTLGVLVSVNKRHGVLETDNHQRIYFLASKVYLFGKRFPSSKSLESGLNITDNFLFDAIPCLPDENEENCGWFATVIFKGKRPEYDEEKIDLDTLSVSANAKTDLYTFIQQVTNDARVVFTTGYGTFISWIDNDLGVLLGEFKRNKYENVLFHKKYAFLFKLCLATKELSESLTEGDRLKFIAVPAPATFFTQWIAVQVAVYYSDSFDFSQKEDFLFS